MTTIHTYALEVPDTWDELYASQTWLIRHVMALPLVRVSKDFMLATILLNPHISFDQVGELVKTKDFATNLGRFTSEDYHDLVKHYRITDFLWEYIPQIKSFDNNSYLQAPKPDLSNIS